MSVIHAMSHVHAEVATFCGPEQVGTLRSSCRALRTMLDGGNALTQSVCRWLLEQNFTGACFSARDFSARVDDRLNRYSDIVAHREHYAAWFSLQIRFKQWVTEAMRESTGFVNIRRRRPDLTSILHVSLMELDTLLRPQWQHVLASESAAFWDALEGGESLECPSLHRLNVMVAFIHDYDICDDLGGPAVSIGNFITALKALS